MTSPASNITPHDVLAEERGWDSSTQLLMRQSYGSVRNTREPGFTVTSGQHHLGSRTLGDFSARDVPSAKERAKLIGFKLEELPRFPPDFTERTRRRLVCEVVPPLFAKEMQRAVHQHIVETVASTRLQTRLTLLHNLSGGFRASLASALDGEAEASRGSFAAPTCTQFSPRLSSRAMALCPCGGPRAVFVETGDVTAASGGGRRFSE